MATTLRWVTSEAEKAEVYRLRYEIYVEGQGLFQDEADHARRWLVDAHDADSRIAVAEVDDELVGTIRGTWGKEVSFCDRTRKSYGIDRFRGVVDESDVILVTRLVVRPEHRGGDLCARLFGKIFELAAETGSELILGTCEVHLVSHYRKLGFRAFGQLYNHPTNGILVPIAAVIADFEYLRRIDSEMLEIVSRRAKPVTRLHEILARVSADPTIFSQDQNTSEEYRHLLTRRLGAASQDLPGILSDSSQEEADHLLARSHLLVCRPGDALIRSGQVARTIFLLLSGSLEVSDPAGHSIRIAEPGSVVGELSLLLARPRPHDVTVGPEGALVIALSDSNLREILASESPLAARLLLFMARGLGRWLVSSFAGVASPVPISATHSRPGRRSPRRLPRRPLAANSSGQIRSTRRPRGKRMWVH